VHKGRRGKETNRKRPDLGERGKESVRTCSHFRHFPDLPGGKISIEGISTEKHCATATKKKVQGQKWVGKKKEERALNKNRISASAKEEGKQKQPREDRSWGGGGEGKRVYVLYLMVVTFPTCHLERSLLKPPAV